MSVSADDLRAKVTGYVGALSKMTEQERKQNPSGNFGNDYNKLRELTLQVMPDKEEVIPPSVTIRRGNIHGEMLCQVRYVEIFAYALQISGLLGNLARDEDR